LTRADIVYNVPDTEIVALQDLYDATNGDSWDWIGMGNKWNFTDPNPCVDAWQGVNCSQIATDGYLHVIEVDLSEYGLAGSIPHTVAELQQLEILDLGWNALTSTIPDGVGQLTQLTALHLEGNRWSGTIPASFQQLTHLTELHLELNLLTGTIPSGLCELSQLAKLVLDDNQLSGTIPAYIGQLTMLTHLILDYNRLSGTIPESLQHLTQLKELYLHHNKLNGTIPAALGQLMLLNILDLGLNQLSGPIPDSFQHLTQLTLLYLHGNQLTGTIPASMGQLSLLTALDLDGNHLTGTIPVSLGQLTEVQLLDVGNNQLTGSIPQSLRQLTQLRWLFLFYNPLKGTIPAALGQLTRLNILDLSATQLSGTIPDSFQQLTQLTELYLFASSLTGTVPASLGQLSLLALLDLYRNQLSGTIPDSLRQLTQLTELYFNDNQLSGTIPSALCELSQLAALELDTNRLSGTLPDALQQLTQLTLVFLETNQLTGTIPGSLVTLVGVKALQLGANQLTGPIPNALAQLVALEVLFLQGNYLTGTIPPSLGQHARLRTVFLGDNQLEGVIPQNWSASASTLEVLHLHENHLSSSIPESLGHMPLLLSLNLSSNCLTGTIPTSLSQLGSLEVLMLHNNQLRGDIDGLFNPSQANLSTVQLSGNRLTGTLPVAAFQLPSLNSFAAVRNCFGGPLPEKAICSSTSLSVLALDGLHSASSCKRSASASHNAFKIGTVPLCLLALPSLATLHLSGSGLTGSLPAEMNVSAVLTDLSLSHNLLKGEIPGSILGRDWDKLDLSYNRLSGTLRSAGAASYSNATKLHLQHNRLSGVIPGSVQRVNTLSLLENNMFSCRVDRSDVPQQNPGSDKYTCGSDPVNNALYAWFGAAIAVTVVCGVTVNGRRINGVSRWMAAVRDTKLCKLRRVAWTADMLRTVAVCSAAYCILVLLPVYTAVNACQPSFTYKYAWTVSGVFLSGTAAFAVEAVFLLVQLPICVYVAERFLSRTGPARQPYEASAAVRPSTASLQQTAAHVAVMAFSLAVVTGTNVAFVIATLNFNGRELTAIQILLAVFKLGFNNLAAPALQNRVRTPGMGHEITASQLLLVLLNVIVIPCLVVMIISPACFYDALTGTDPVTSSFDYGGSCQEPIVYVTGAGNVVDVTCASVQTEVGITTYKPPYTYSYQCSSSFVTSYAPTFTIMCIISGFVVPAYNLMLLQLRHRLSPTSRLHSTVTAATPRILKELPSPQDLAQARSNPLYRPVFDANKLVMSLLTYLALLLTFGALFPPLAVCCAVAMGSVVLTARLEVGRYVSAAVAADRQDCLQEVESACAGVSAPQQLRMALYLVLTMSCMFYTLFLFDTLGYEVGFAGAFWVLIVVPMLPVAAWVLNTAIRLRSLRWAASSATVKDSNAPDLEVGVELANVPVASNTGLVPAAVVEESDTPAAARTEPQHLEFASANPMHAP
jgi:Leucine-rich repeat (LRR) protein